MSNSKWAECMRVEQPTPVINKHPAVWTLVMEDMAMRDKIGKERYGVALQPHNGRDSLRDLMEELLDATVYTRCFIEEMKILGDQLRCVILKLDQGNANTIQIANELREILKKNPALNAK